MGRLLTRANQQAGQEKGVGEQVRCFFSPPGDAWISEGGVNGRARFCDHPGRIGTLMGGEAAATEVPAVQRPPRRRTLLGRTVGCLHSSVPELQRAAVGLAAEAEAAVGFDSTAGGPASSTGHDTPPVRVMPPDAQITDAIQAWLANRTEQERASAPSMGELRTALEETLVCGSLASRSGFIAAVAFSILQEAEETSGGVPVFSPTI